MWECEGTVVSAILNPYLLTGDCSATGVRVFRGRKAERRSFPTRPYPCDNVHTVRDSASASVHQSQSLLLLPRGLQIGGQQGSWHTVCGEGLRGGSGVEKRKTFRSLKKPLSFVDGRVWRVCLFVFFLFFECALLCFPLTDARPSSLNRLQKSSNLSSACPAWSWRGPREAKVIR